MRLEFKVTQRPLIAVQGTDQVDMANHMVPFHKMNIIEQWDLTEAPGDLVAILMQMEGAAHFLKVKDYTEPLHLEKGTMLQVSPKFRDRIRLFTEAMDICIKDIL